jgi:histidinol-phosphate aminotransferase
LDEAIAAAQAELPASNFYTKPYSEPLHRFLAESIGVPERLIHINAGSELILRQLFKRLGQQVHLLTPTYALFPEVAKRYTETPLLPENDFAFDLARLEIPSGTTLAAIVNPNNPNGGIFDMTPLPNLLRRHPKTRVLVDEAFIGMAGQSVAHLVPKYSNLLVTRTLSKAHSLAGFRVGYAILPEDLADDLNTHNDAYPLARPSQAAALATLQQEEKIRERASRLRERQVLIKPLKDPRLGPGYLRVTTALPEENARFLKELQTLLRP